MTHHIKLKPDIIRLINLKTPLHPSNKWIPVGIGNYYKGTWNHRTMFGNGILVMLNGNQ